jgi:Putative zinc-finger
MDAHEKYLELCAAATAGELTGQEEEDLEEHLSVCASCRRAKHEFELAIQKAVPALDNHVASRSEESDPNWSIEKAEAALFERLQTDRGTGPLDDDEVEKANDAPAGHRFTYRPSRIPWAELWMPVAACVLLAIALGILAYRSGLKRGADSARLLAPSAKSSSGSVEEQISDSGHERAQLLARLADDDRTLKDLKSELAAEAEEIKRLKSASDVAVARTRGDERPGVNAEADSSRRDAELAAAQANLQALQIKADALGQQREDVARHALALEVKVEELTQIVRDRDRALDEQQAEVTKQRELLDHDRDIRELMGARDLYIAEVHDVAGNGETEKTYGRVFYTKGKSLIFYAYDLDQEAGLKNASTFQAWGRRGVDKQQALSLGVFYEDNASKKRWVLKFDDPKALATIDAVFVTAEPNGGSHHPSGKQLLFAYLRVNPNHP